MPQRYKTPRGEQEHRERAEKMYAMYADPIHPATLAEVGIEFGGVTKFTVFRILTSHGYKVRSQSETKALTKSRPSKS